MKVLLGDGNAVELEISGTAVEWVAFSHAICQNGMAIPCEIVRDTTPYSLALQSIVVSHSPNEPVEFHVIDGRTLGLRGDPVQIEKLSATARNLSREFPIGSHVHIEFQDTNHYIGQNSIPVVFALE